MSVTVGVELKSRADTSGFADFEASLKRTGQQVAGTLKSMALGFVVFDTLRDGLRFLGEAASEAAKRNDEAAAAQKRFATAVADFKAGLGDAIVESSLYQGALNKLASVMRTFEPVQIAQPAAVSDVDRYAAKIREGTNEADAATPKLKALRQEYEALAAVLAYTAPNETTPAKIAQIGRLFDELQKYEVAAQKAMERAQDEQMERMRTAWDLGGRQEVEAARAAAKAAADARASEAATLQARLDAAAAAQAQRNIDLKRAQFEAEGDLAIEAYQRTADEIDRIWATMPGLSDIEETPGAKIADGMYLAIDAVRLFGAEFAHALGKGDFGAKKFGISLLGAVGGFAQSMGASIMLTNTAFALTAAFNPAAAIGIGAALVALGAGLQAAAGELGSKGGSSAPAPTPRAADFRAPVADREERVTRIEINTSGGSAADSIVGRSIELLAQSGHLTIRPVN